MIVKALNPTDFLWSGLSLWESQSGEDIQRKQKVSYFFFLRQSFLYELISCCSDFELWHNCFPGKVVYIGDPLRGTKPYWQKWLYLVARELFSLIVPDFVKSTLLSFFLSIFFSFLTFILRTICSSFLQTNFRKT